MMTECINLLLLTISAFWSSSRWPRATLMSSRRQRNIPLGVVIDRFHCTCILQKSARVRIHLAFDINFDIFTDRWSMFFAVGYIYVYVSMALKHCHCYTRQCNTRKYLELAALGIHCRWTGDFSTAHFRLHTTIFGGYLTRLNLNLTHFFLVRITKDKNSESSCPSWQGLLWVACESGDNLLQWVLPHPLCQPGVSSKTATHLSTGSRT